MDFLNKAYGQLVELYKSMTPAARITSGLLLCVVVISLFYLFQYQSSAGDVYLYGGEEFSQSQLAAMETALGKAGLADFAIKGNRISVPRNQKAAYIKAIADGNATPKDVMTMSDASEGYNPFISSQQHRLLTLQARNKKLAAAIQKMDGIEYVTAELAENETSRFPRTIERGAAITVKAVGSRALDSHEINSIRNYVLAYEPGIKSSNITIIDQNTNRSHRGPGEDSHLDPQYNPYAANKKYYEDFYRRKIEERLAAYNANVQVEVELDPTLDHTKNIHQLEGTPVAITQSADKKNTQSTTPGVRGTVGTRSNVSGANDNQTVSVTNQQTETTSDESSESTESIVGRSSTSTKQAGLVPRTVNVSIGIPEGYYRKLWLANNPPVEGEDPKPMPPGEYDRLVTQTKTQVEEIVRSLLPKRNQGDDPYEYIVVRPDPEILSEPVQPPGFSAHAFSWLSQNWQTLGILFVGMFGIVMLRGMIKSAATAATSEAPSSVPLLQQESTGVEGEEAEEEAAEPRENSLLKRFGSSDPSLQDELTELVQADPDAAANVLRSWIGQLD